MTSDDDGWTLISHDHFDRDADPSVDASGLALHDGLRRLWCSTLNERVLPDGQRGFISFDLHRDGEVIRIPEPFDHFEDLARIRRWVAGPEGRVPDDAPLLETIARAHLHLYHRGRDAEAIVELARSAGDAASYQRLLETLVE